MGKIKDLEGKIYDKLSVVKYVGLNNHNKAIWECLCDCGNSIDVIGVLLTNGHTKSCGCLKSEMIASKNVSNGFRADCEIKFRDRWRHMMSRCYDDKNPSYSNYGGRGIKVCKEWHDMRTYCEYISNLFKGEEPYLEVDRINNNGDYCPDNIKLSTKLENMSNTSRNRYFYAKSPDGDIYISNNINEFSRQHGLNRSCVQRCLKNKQKHHFEWEFNYRKGE